MRQIKDKKLISPESSNPIKAAEEIKKIIKKSEVNNLELDLSMMNIIDAVKVLVMTSSYLYKKSPDEKIKFRFVTSEIKNLLNTFSLTNLEMNENTI